MAATVHELRPTPDLATLIAEIEAAVDDKTQAEKYCALAKVIHWRGEQAGRAAERAALAAQA
jgi:hypothetical protein